MKKIRIKALRKLIQKTIQNGNNAICEDDLFKFVDIYGDDWFIGLKGTYELCERNVKTDALLGLENKIKGDE